MHKCIVIPYSLVRGLQGSYRDGATYVIASLSLGLYK